jgi:hypothetical protein
VRRAGPTWQDLLFIAFSMAVLLGGLWLRLHRLVVGIGNANGDEGVYLQTLRSMASGHALYRPTFFSQPPFFMQAMYLPFVLFGQTLWAARLGVALVSLLGLLGAYLVGYSLAGRSGAIAGLLLIVANAPYLAASRQLRAEGLCVPLELLAVALAYLWLRRPDGWRGGAMASLSGAALALAIMSKLFGLAAVVPIGLLALIRLRDVLGRPAEERFKAGASLAAGLVAFVVTTGLVLLPFAGSGAALWRDAVTFHIAARTLAGSQLQNLPLIGEALWTPLAAVALLGALVALVRRNWLVLPLLAWLAASVYLLWNEIPLFGHHTVILVPPLVSLAVTAFGPTNNRGNLARHWKTAAILALVLPLAIAVNDIAEARLYLRQITSHSASTEQGALRRVVDDLHAFVPAGRLVVTDDQAAAAAADRSTPPDLVDTSFVRIDSGYLTSAELISDASRPDVSAVLFYSGRFIHYTDPRQRVSLAAFQAWVKNHLRLARDYGDNRTLWVKHFP